MMQKVKTNHSPDKRVNIISIADKVLMRTTRSYAAKLVQDGTHRYTSKGKLRNFLNKTRKLYNNEKAIAKIDLKDKKAGHIVLTDPYSKKTYVGIKRKEVDVVMIKKDEVDPLTGKPKEFTVKQPRHEIRVARYPTY